ncbi:MAG TPA: MarC family protein, partial [Acidisoma sp.]|nr:MarC family protein [Acidisoma sp.]
MPIIVLPVAADFFKTVLLTFSALFAIVNPIVNAIIFAQITADRTHAERLRLARRVGLYSFGLMLFALWVSSYVLNFFGISLGALKVAGGLVIAFGAWRLLHAPEQREALKDAQARQDGRTTAALDVNGIAFFPVSIPFTVGPGTISVCISLSASHPTAGSALPYLAALSTAALAMAIVVWLSMSFADQMAPLFGKTGARAVTRLFALLLFCIAVQIM